jgi:hypothetical protein
VQQQDGRLLPRDCLQLLHCRRRTEEANILEEESDGHNGITIKTIDGRVLRDLAAEWFDEPDGR